jgi:hypothetical protein
MLSRSCGTSVDARQENAMNKVTRFFGSAALVAGLTVGGSALTAGAAYAGDDYDRSNHNKHDDDDKRKHDWKDHNGRDHKSDRHDDHKSDKDDRHRGDYKYVYDHKDDDHDEDCNGKYHRAWYKDHYGQWQFIIVIVYQH